MTLDPTPCSVCGVTVTISIINGQWSAVTEDGSIHFHDGEE